MRPPSTASICSRRWTVALHACLHLTLLVDFKTRTLPAQPTSSWKSRVTRDSSITSRFSGVWHVSAYSGLETVVIKAVLAQDNMTPRDPKRNVTRDRRRAEADALRREVERLERELVVLTKQRLQRRLSPPSSTDEERRKRQLAEAEHRQLQAAVDELMQLGGALVRAIAEQEASVPATLSSNELHDFKGSRFAQLMSEVDRAYSRVDTIFLGDHAAVTPIHFTTSMTSRFVDGCERPAIEGRESSMIPFDFELCCSSLWRATKLTLWSDYPQVEVYGNHPDYKMGRLQWTHESTQVTCTMVMKRFVEQDRMIVVWRGVTSMGSNSDSYIEETGWSLLHRVADRLPGEYTTRQNFLEWVPRSQLGESRSVDDLAGLVAVTQNDTTCVDLHMENLLLEDILPVSISA